MRSTDSALRLLAILVIGTFCGVAGARAEPLTVDSPRELTTDRPDATESPFTVNAGLVQLEMSFASYTRDDVDNVRYTTWEAAPLNLRFGVANNLEAGIFITPHVDVTAETPDGAKTSLRGFGDIVLRGKLNFWGNDGGPTALGIFADLKLPTAKGDLSNGKVEASLTLPVAYELVGGWEGAAMTALEMRYTGRDRYEPVWFNTITFARDLAKNLGGFLELTSETGDGSHAATFNTGITWRTDSNTQWDCGAVFGISEAAPDLGLFFGLSKRF